MHSAPHVKHLHILGIGGTFMGGLAQIARQMGYKVTGQDRPLYPPMSTQLAQADISVRAMDDVSFVAEQPDMIVVGNVMTRGMSAVEALLESGLPFISGPAWLADVALAGKWVLAVSGTHGKTTTSSMLAWILEDAKLSPGFLIGGVPANFGVSARWSDSPFFVVEADEYDSAFFDKRAKLVHYKPRTWVLNNLEFDHADIYDNLAQIQRQIHHGVRLVPASGLLIAPQDDTGVAGALALGYWSGVETTQPNGTLGWSWQLLTDDASAFVVLLDGAEVGRVHWQLMGEFNIRNALHAIAAARHAGVPVSVACDALSRFAGVARRLTLLSDANADMLVYEDFAHHPTAIAVTLQGLRARYPNRRLIAVVEPRSNSMRMGVFKDALPASLSVADVVLMYRDASWDWQIPEAAFTQSLTICQSYDALLTSVADMVQAGDVLVCMSNGGFGGVPARVAKLIATRSVA